MKNLNPMWMGTGMKIEIINGDWDGESKILPKSNPLSSLFQTMLNICFLSLVLSRNQKQPLSIEQGMKMDALYFTSSMDCIPKVNLLAACMLLQMICFSVLVSSHSKTYHVEHGQHCPNLLSPWSVADT